MSNTWLMGLQRNQMFLMRFASASEGCKGLRFSQALTALNLLTGPQ